MKKGLSAKTKSAETLVKSVADNRSRATGQSRTDSSVFRTPSLHPWYYVKGRRDLTEKNISSRREREDQKYKQSLSNSKYFSKQSADSQLFQDWSHNKTLVKHSKSDSVLRPPYDVFAEPKIDPRLKCKSDKELTKKYSKALKSLKTFVDIFKEMDEKYNRLEKRQNILVFQLNEIQRIKTSFEEKKQFYELTSKGLKHIRFRRDRLRKKVFQIFDQLNYYKVLVEKIELLKDSKGILTEEETIALTEVIDRAIKILSMYISLNENRNKEFQLMFDEEADNYWESQETEWQTEYEVWTLMTDKLIVSYNNVVKEKLNQILSEETTALDERQRVVKELKELSAKIKSDSQISWLLTENIEDLLTEENQKTKSQAN